MLCRGCDELVRAEESQRGRAVPPQAREPPVEDHLCARCGNLLGTDDIVKRAKQKRSQLERFGLSGPRRLLLKPTGGETT